MEKPALPFGTWYLKMTVNAQPWVLHVYRAANAGIGLPGHGGGHKRTLARLYDPSRKENAPFDVNVGWDGTILWIAYPDAQGLTVIRGEVVRGILVGRYGFGAPELVHDLAPKDLPIGVTGWRREDFDLDDDGHPSLWPRVFAMTSGPLLGWLRLDALGGVVPSGRLDGFSDGGSSPALDVAWDGTNLGFTLGQYAFQGHRLAMMAYFDVPENLYLYFHYFGHWFSFGDVIPYLVRHGDPDGYDPPQDPRWGLNYPRFVLPEVGVDWLDDLGVNREGITLFEWIRCNAPRLLRLPSPRKGIVHNPRVWLGPDAFGHDLKRHVEAAPWRDATVTAASQDRWAPPVIHRAHRRGGGGALAAVRGGAPRHACACGCGGRSGKPPCAGWAGVAATGIACPRPRLPSVSINGAGGCSCPGARGCNRPSPRAILALPRY